MHDIVVAAKIETRTLTKGWVLDFRLGTFGPSFDESRTQRLRSSIVPEQLRSSIVPEQS
jgi:hypothetical protein